MKRWQVQRPWYLHLGGHHRPDKDGTLAVFCTRRLAGRFNGLRRVPRPRPKKERGVRWQIPG